MENEDDILETALNSGLSFAADKYNISKEDVYQIVRKFKVDIEDLCSCDKERMLGRSCFCFMCDGFSNRIKL